MKDMESKVKNPHRMQAISWRDGVEKEEVVSILNSPEVNQYIPEEMRSYQGHNSAGKRVLWAVRKIKELARLGMIDAQKPIWGKSEEVEALEKKIEELEKLVSFYRKVARHEGLTIDEEKGCFREKYDDTWIQPA